MPVVNGRWYPTLGEGYADSPFVRGEVEGCIHDPTRFVEDRGCDECDRLLRAIHAEEKAKWPPRDKRPNRAGGLTFSWHQFWADLWPMFVGQWFAATLGVSVGIAVADSPVEVAAWVGALSIAGLLLGGYVALRRKG